MLTKRLSAIVRIWGAHGALRDQGSECLPFRRRVSPLIVICLVLAQGTAALSYFSKGIEKTQIKRDDKATLLAAVRDGRCEPSHGMTKEDAITILIQDIADYDQILARLRTHNGT